MIGKPHDITKFEAELEALSEKFHANQAKRKALVIDDPVELFQALSPVGMSVTGDEKRLYYLLGLLTRQGLDLTLSPRGTALTMTDEHIFDTVKELSEYIETAVENYIEESSDG